MYLTDKSVAMHEAGHFFAGWKLNLALESVTIEPTGDGASGRVCRGLREVTGLDDRDPEARLHNEDSIIECLAGPAAEYLFLQRPDWRTLPSDLTAAVQYACFRHFDGSKENVTAYLSYLWVVTNSLVNEALNWHCISVLAEELLKKRTMQSAEAIAILETAKKDFIKKGGRRNQPVMNIIHAEDYGRMVAEVLKSWGAI